MTKSRYRLISHARFTSNFGTSFLLFEIAVFGILLSGTFQGITRHAVAVLEELLRILGSVSIAALLYTVILSFVLWGRKIVPPNPGFVLRGLLALAVSISVLILVSVYVSILGYG